MQTINILSRSGTTFPLNLSQNNVIRSGCSHTLTLQLKYNGSSYLIQTAELKPTRPVGRPNRFCTQEITRQGYFIIFYFSKNRNKFLNINK